MTRIHRDDLMVEITKLVSLRGTCLRAQVGSVIERGGRILMTGYNGSLPGEPHCLDVGCEMVEGHCIRTVHAEANAICWAARRGIAIEGSTLWTYGWKDGICHRCRKLCLSAGISDIREIPLDAPEVSHSNVAVKITEMLIKNGWVDELERTSDLLKQDITNLL